MPSSWTIAQDSVGLRPCSAILFAKATIFGPNFLSSRLVASASFSTVGRPRRGFRRSRWRRLMERFLCPLGAMSQALSYSNAIDLKVAAFGRIMSVKVRILLEDTATAALYCMVVRRGATNFACFMLLAHRSLAHSEVNLQRDSVHVTATLLPTRGGCRPRH